MKTVKRALLIGAIATALAIGLVVWSLQRFLHAPLVVDEQGTSFEVASGTSFGRVSKNLAELGIINSPDMFRAYARWTGQAEEIQAGYYLILPGTTPAELLDQFVTGAVQLYSFTIIEGWNHRELLRAMRDDEHIVATMTDEDWPALLEELGATSSHPEGLFLPETYHYARNSSDRALLRRAFELLQQTLQAEWDGRADGLPFESPYEALILASIVEKETARADERERIAGVFVRRLQKRQRLQTDPTVIYGIGPGFNGNLTRKDLQTDTPYNTYTRHGLPPTPIALAGNAAIRAALHPAAGNELYFVATGLGDGSHQFSETIDQHNAAVAEYLKRLRAQRLKGKQDATR